MMFGEWHEPILEWLLALMVSAQEGAPFATTVTVLVAIVVPSLRQEKTFVKVCAVVETVQPLIAHVHACAIAPFEKDPTDAAKAMEARVSLFMISPDCVK